jgi:arylsulfatase A-like enzyme/Flp pilus assembly protein TadD
MSIAGLLLVGIPLRAQETAPQPRATRAIPIILVSVDTLRADHLECYGYRDATTPSIDALAANGTLFSEANSQIPITLPSHMSLFTSTYPFAGGVEENGERVPAGAITLAEVLRQHGWSTAAFIGGYFLARDFGLDQGFAFYDSPFTSRMESLGSPAALKRPATDVLAGARKWLAGRDRGVPFFLFIHLFDLHRPYTEPENFRARYPASEYDAEIAYADTALGEFWQFLKDQGLFSRSLIVFLSDHGESLGEHGESTHGYFIYQSTLHVPLVIHWPEGSPPQPARVDEPVGLIDVAPTIVQFLNLPQPTTFQGQSLLGLLKADASYAPREVYGESAYAHDKFGWAPLRSLRVGNFKYIDAPNAELYDLTHDPGEQHNLISARTTVASSLRDRLWDVRKRLSLGSPGLPSPAQVSPEVLAGLHALGYLGFSGIYSGRNTTGPDPKDRLTEYRQYLRGLELSQTGHADEAAATFREVLDEDDQNLPAHDDLADCYFQLRRFFDAANELRASLALDPHDVRAEERLASIWLETGNKPRARAEFERLLSFAPDNYTALRGLGLLDRDAGRVDDALRDFQAAAQARPDSAAAHESLGEAYLKKGDFDAAAREFRRALELNPALEADRDALRRIGAAKQ